MRIYEQQLIGAVISGTVKPSDVGLTATDFQDETLADVLTVTRKMESDGVDINAESVYLNFTENDIGWLNQSDLEKYADNISITTYNNALEKVQSSILQKTLRRDLELILENPEMSGGLILNTLKEKIELYETEYRSQSNNFEFISEFAEDQLKIYQELHEGKAIAVPTFFKTLDSRILDGFSKGDQHVIVGMTGSGKTALALNFARNQARNGFTVGIVSREMARAENVMRLQASDGRIPRWQIKKDMNVTVLNELKENLLKIKDYRIAIDTKTTDVESLRLQVKLMIENHGLDILYVDYLQLMESSGKHSTRANEVQKISRNLKEIAMTHNIPIVSLCQFNRGAASADVTDMMNHLKESSGIEQDASTIILIQTDKTELNIKTVEAKATVLKNRNGATFNPVDMKFTGEIFQFSEVANEPFN